MTRKKSHQKILAQLRERRAQSLKQTAVKPMVKINRNAIKDYLTVKLKESKRILLLGEGNLSFASFLASNDYDIIPTVYDTKEQLLDKYSDAEMHLKTLQDKYMECLFSIDSTTLHKYKSIYSKEFDCIVFNFPHVGKGIKDQEYNIKANQELLQSTFQSISQLNKQVSICITLKDKEPYTKWNLKAIAAQCGYSCQRSCQFLPLHFKGYEHRRTAGFKDGKSKGDNEELGKCRTFIFHSK